MEWTAACATNLHAVLFPDTGVGAAIAPFHGALSVAHAVSPAASVHATFGELIGASVTHLQEPEKRCAGQSTASIQSTRTTRR